MSHLKGLITPPLGFVSSCPPLVGAGSPVKLLGWETIKSIASDGKMSGVTRYGTRFHDVQRHNNCAGDSASRMLAKAIYDRRGEHVVLSGTYTYSLINGGSDNGAMLADAMASLERDGVALAKTVGSDAIFSYQYDRHAAAKEAQRFRARECYAIRPRDHRGADELQRAVWTALALGFKLGVAVQAGNRFDQIDRNGICGVDGGAGNHAVHADGIAIRAGAIVATSENTWPLSWGDNGRMLLRWEHFRETIGVHEFYAIRDVVDDQLGPKPPEVLA